MRKSLAVLTLPILAALVIAGCGGSSNSGSGASSAGSSSTSSKAAPASSSSSTSTSAAAAPKAGGVTITTKTVPTLGTILVNSQGRTLYMFKPDNGKRVTCTGPCSAVWPPVKIPAGAKASGAGGVKASLLGSDPDPSGGNVVTYAGWPLYLYVADSAPGSMAGQAVNLNGGLWYVLSPSGKVITGKA